MYILNNYIVHLKLWTKILIKQLHKHQTHAINLVDLWECTGQQDNTIKQKMFSTLVLLAILDTIFFSINGNGEIAKSSPSHVNSIQGQILQEQNAQLKA